MQKSWIVIDLWIRNITPDEKIPYKWNRNLKWPQPETKIVGKREGNWVVKLLLSHQGSIQNLTLLPRPTLKLISSLNLSTHAAIALHIPDALGGKKLISHPWFPTLYIWIKIGFQWQSPSVPSLQSHLERRAVLTSLIGPTPRPSWRVGRETCSHLTRWVFSSILLVTSQGVLHDSLQWLSNFTWASKCR